MTPAEMTPTDYLSNLRDFLTEGNSLRAGAALILIWKHCDRLTQDTALRLAQQLGYDPVSLTDAAIAWVKAFQRQN